MLAIEPYMKAQNFEDFSPEAKEAYLKVLHGMPLAKADYDLWLSPREAAQFLSWKKTKDIGKESVVSVRYISQLLYHGRLKPGPTSGRGYRYRLSEVLSVHFDPPGPKPKDKSASRGEGLS